jgi:hypothetical protein
MCCLMHFRTATGSEFTLDFDRTLIRVDSEGSIETYTEISRVEFAHTREGIVVVFSIPFPNGRILSLTTSRVVGFGAGRAVSK